MIDESRILELYGYTSDKLLYYKSGLSVGKTNTEEVCKTETNTYETTNRGKQTCQQKQQQRT